MRILLTTDTVGGVWQYSQTLLRELVERGHEIMLAVFGSLSDERASSLPPEVGVATRDLALEWMPGAAQDLERGTEWLERLAVAWGPDVIHLNQFAYARGRYAAPVLVVAHSDVRSWYADVRGVEPPAGWDAYSDIVRAGLHAAAAVVAPTAYQSGRLAQHYGRTAARVIHNGIEPPPVPPEEVRAAQRPLVLLAGRAWDEAKGVSVVEEALEHMGEDAPSIHLVGPLEGPAGEIARVHRLVAHGEVPGSAMDRFYQNTRVYIGASLYEPFGLTPLEAAAHGCALLLSGIGSFRELWTDAASFFEPGSAADLAVRLRNLLEDPQQLNEQAWQARIRARSDYTAARMVDRYEALYREITDHGGRHRPRAATLNAAS